MTVLYSDNILDQNNRPVEGAEVYVYEQNAPGAQSSNSSLPLATIFDTDDTSVTQPLKTDQDGKFSFKADEALYRIDVFVGGVKIYSSGNVVVGDPAVVYQGGVGPIGPSNNTFGSIALLEAAPTLNGDSSFLSSAGREGHFVFSNADLSAEIVGDPSQGVYIAPTSDATGASGAWVRQHEGWIDVRWFGAVLDSDPISGGGTDDTAALNACGTFCKAGARQGLAPFIPFGLTARITGIVDWRGLFEIQLLGAVFRSDASAQIIAGALSSQTNCNWVFNEITDGLNYLSDPRPTTPLLDLRGFKNSRIRIGDCRYVRFYADDAISGEGSMSYSDIDMGFVPHLVLDGAAGVSWINECKLRGGRVTTLDLEGSYGHDNLHLDRLTFEGTDVEINIGTAGAAVRNLKITGARMENTSGATITFGENVYHCFLLVSTTGFVKNSLGRPEINIVDNGGGNFVSFERDALLKKVMVAEFDPYKLVATAGSNGSPDNTSVRHRGLYLVPGGLVVPGIKKASSGPNRLLFSSDIIPAYKGMQGIFYCDGPGASHRILVEIFDEDMQPITSTGGGAEYLINTWGPTLDPAGYYNSSDVDTDQFNAGAYFTINRSEVAFIRCHAAVGSNYTGPMGRASCWVYERPDLVNSPRGNVHRPAVGVIDATPTKGAAPVGTEFMKDDGSAMYRSVFDHLTNLDSSVATSGTSVTVDDATGVQDGDIVGILLDDELTHWGTVASLSGSTFTVTAFPSGAGAGNAVRFGRFV